MAAIKSLLKGRDDTIFSIAPGATALEAAQTMAEKNIGALMVMTGDNVDGILSERDIVRKVAAPGKSARDILVRDIMTTKVLYVEAAETIEACMALMVDKNVRHLPIYENGKLLGMISVRDVVKAAIAEQQFMISQLEHYITGGGR
jgi:CBS domain-containing protein